MAGKNYDSLLANWKCMLAIVLVSMSPFQYGIDFGLIGGIQAMIGFMQIFGYRAPDTPIGWNICRSFAYNLLMRRMNVMTALSK